MKLMQALLGCAIVVAPATALAQTEAGTPPGQEPALTPGNGTSSSRSGTTITNNGLANVWAIPAQSRYFCPGDKRYGKGKSGTYMSEADARNAGDKPAHGKTCS